MAQTIRIKRSTTTAVPTALSNGELAYSSNGNKLFIGRPGGTSGDIDAVGGKYYTDIITAATNANTADTLVLRDGSGNFSAGTVTATFLGNLTGNITGNADTATTLQTARTIGGVSFDGSVNIDLPGVTIAGNQDTSGNAATATALQTARTISLTGDATASGSFDGTANYSEALTLATVNATVGTFGSATAIPVVTVNGKGLVTSVSTAAISSTLDIAADSGTDNGVLIGTDTLTISGGTGVATSVSGDTITVDIGQAVGTTDNVTFNNVTVNGTLSSDDITAATMTASGDVIVSGNLTVNGTTTTVNSNDVNIGDAILTLNSDETGTPSANAGLEVERGTSTNVSLLWNETGDYWQLTEDGSTYSKILTAANFEASFTGTLDGGTF